jgi:hypothetical protein
MVKAGVQATTQSIPTQLVFFGRDVMLNVTHKASWQHVKDRKQKLI